MKELPVISAGPQSHRPGDTSPIVGIDLGTSNSLVAIVQPDAGGTRRPRVLPSRDGRNLVPSVVRFTENAAPIVGDAARRERVRDPEHTVYSVKRLLGRGAGDVSESLRKAFSLETSSESNIRVSIGSHSYTPIEISAMILRELKAAAEEALGQNVEDAVITVPAYFNDSQRQATRAAGRLAGFNVLRILNEPTAAALAYGLDRKKNGSIAVYDLGGGTFDVSILKLRDGVFEVLATNGDTSLGGDDFDEAVAQRLCEQILKKQPGADVASREARAALLEAAETLKIGLSQTETATTEARVLVKGSQVTERFSLNRHELAGLVAPILERTAKPVRDALKDAGLAASELTDVVLVGGPTRLAVVQDFVAKLFGRAPNASLHPDEVVALGAAIQADILAGHNTDLLLLDVVPLSLGIETFGGAMSVLIPRNTTVPALAKEQFTTHVEGQTKVAINVFQGERELVAENRKLAEFVLSGVPPLPAGVARVEVTFLVDADGILSVSAREVYSEVEASVEVRPTYGLTDAQVESMLADGLANGAKDRTAARLIEARNDASTVLTATEKALTEARDLLADDETRSIERLAGALRAAMSEGTAEDVRRASDELNRGTLHLAELLMSKTLQTRVKNKRVGDLL